MTQPTLTPAEAIAKLREMDAQMTKAPFVVDEFCMQDGRRTRIGTNDGSAIYYHRSATVAECFPNDDDDMEGFATGEPLIGTVQAERNAAGFAWSRNNLTALADLISNQQALLDSTTQALGEVEAKLAEAKWLMLRLNTQDKQDLAEAVQGIRNWLTINKDLLP